MTELLERVVSTHSSQVIVDITGVEHVDELSADHRVCMAPRDPACAPCARTPFYVRRLCLRVPAFLVRRRMSRDGRFGPKR